MCVVRFTTDTAITDNLRRLQISEIIRQIYASEVFVTKAVEAGVHRLREVNLQLQHAVEAQAESAGIARTRRLKTSTENWKSSWQVAAKRWALLTSRSNVI